MSLDFQGLDGPYPHDVPDVKTGLEQLSQRDCLVAADELMSRRGLARKDRDFLAAVWRQDRIAWGIGQRAKQDKKENEE